MMLRSVQLVALCAALAVIQRSSLGVHGSHSIDLGPDDNLVVPSFVPRGICGQQHDAPVLDANKAGSTAARPSSWPWAVSIRNASHPLIHVCAGVIVSMRHVLTTAGCALSVSPRAHAHQLLVVMGASGPLSRSSRASEVHIHPEYAPYPLDHDVAVIKLTHNITLSDSVGVVCLPAKSRVHGNEGVFVSWNQPSFPPNSDQLHQNNFTVENKNPACTNKGTCGTFVNSKHSYCGLATEKADQSAGCYGDIGGPLQFQIKNRWYVYGLLEYFPTARSSIVASFGDSRSNDNVCVAGAPRYFSKVEVDIGWIEVKLKNYPDYS